MVRRKKPKITGADPNYSHTFERFRAVESDMPPDVKIPGVNDQSTSPHQAATTTNEEAGVVEPKATTAETKTPAPKAKKPVAKPKAKSKDDCSKTDYSKTETRTGRGAKCIQSATR